MNSIPVLSKEAKHMRHIIPISGKDSLATALVQMTRQPNLPYELFFNDVGTELPETYEWLNKVEQNLKLPLHKIGKSLEDLIKGYNFLPSPSVRFCTRAGKIEPMEKWIGDAEATIYFGIRADEDRAGYTSHRHNIIPKYPLKDMGIGLNAVLQIVENRNLSPPKFFWNEVYNLVTQKINKRNASGFGLLKSAEEQFEGLPRWFFDRLFAWRSRPNCYFCFFQRHYEWVGLLQHHPNLFDKAEHLETTTAKDRAEGSYTWVQDYPLSLIRRRAGTIIKKRVNHIIKQLDAIETRKVSLDVVDLLSVTSCGLFCGK